MSDPPFQEVPCPLVGHRDKDGALAALTDDIGAVVTDHVSRDPNLDGIRTRQTTAPCAQRDSPVSIVFDRVLHHDRLGLVVVCDCPRSPVRAPGASEDTYAGSKPDSSPCSAQS